MQEVEGWSWSKFFKGFFDGKNYAKAVVMMFCMFVILIIVYSVTNTVSSRFKKPPVTQTESIGTVEGNVQKEDSHNTVTVVHNHFPLSDILSNILSFGAKNKVESDK
jgi:hypothetical protein